MVTFRSLPKGSSAASTGVAPTKANVVNARTESGCFVMVSPARVLQRGNSDLRERFRIGENAPDRFPRRGDGVGERCVRVLQQRDHLQQQLLVSLAKVCQCDFDLAVVESPKLIEQVVDL